MGVGGPVATGQHIHIHVNAGRQSGLHRTLHVPMLCHSCSTDTDRHSWREQTLMLMPGSCLAFTEPCMYPCYVKKEREKKRRCQFNEARYYTRLPRPMLHEPCSVDKDRHSWWERQTHVNAWRRLLEADSCLYVYIRHQPCDREKLWMTWTMNSSLKKLPKTVLMLVNQSVAAE